MTYVQSSLVNYQGGKHMAKAASDIKLGPRSTATTQHGIKAGRLKGQLFACKLGFTSLAALDTNE